MKATLGIAAGAAGVAAFAFVGPVTAGPDDNNQYDNTVSSRDCGDSDTVVYTGPEKMWPPNHKLQNVSVVATDGGSDNGSDQTMVTVTPAVTDVAGGDGGPQHDPDFTPGNLVGSGDPSATVDFWLRAERSGKGDGRTYTINWSATFDGGAKTCSSSDAGQSPFLVTVPHDMRPSNR
jgi:hypothetical protein